MNLKWKLLFSQRQRMSMRFPQIPSPSIITCTDLIDALSSAYSTNSDGFSWCSPHFAPEPFHTHTPTLFVHYRWRNSLWEAQNTHNQLQLTQFTRNSFRFPFPFLLSLSFSPSLSLFKSPFPFFFSFPFLLSPFPLQMERTGNLFMAQSKVLVTWQKNWTPKFLAIWMLI